MSIEPIDHSVLVKQVADAIRHADAAVSTTRAPQWQLNAQARDGGQRCGYCGSAFANQARTRAMDLLVPLAHGGNHRSENAVLACKRCRGERAQMDLLSWPRLETLADRDAFVQRRLKAFETCANHLTPDPPWVSKATLLKHLTQRWQLPRVRLYAVHSQPRSFIGWTTHRGAPADFGLARLIARSPHGGTLELDGSVVVYSLDASRFLDLVWSLIDANALVNRLHLDTPCVPVDLTDWRHFWPVQLSHLGDLRRRRARLMGHRVRIPGDPSVLEEAQDLAAPAPHKPRELGTSSKQIRERERQRRIARKQRHHDFLVARAGLDRLAEDVAAGRAIEPTPHEWLLMKQDMLRILLPDYRPGSR